MALASGCRAGARPGGPRAAYVLGPPRKLYLLELLRAVDLADRIDRAGDVARIHAHFAHGTTTVAWLASTITGLPFSFTGHAKDIYTEELNPAGLLRRKMDAASFVATCTEANRRHLASLGSSTPVHVVYHGLNADFEELVAVPARTGDVPAKVRLLAVGRLVRKKGLDTFVDACALLRGRGLDFEAVIAGESGESEQQVRDRVTAGGLEGHVTLLGPLTQEGLFEEYRRGQRVRPALPGARGRRPGRHPERADGGHGLRRARGHHRGSPGSPSSCVMARTG